MSDDSKHSLDDLFEGTEGDDGSTDDNQSTSDEFQEDEAGNQLDLPKNEQAKAKFANDWAKKIKSGDKTLEELEEKQAWLVPSVKELLKDEPVKVDKDELSKLAREAAKELLEEERRSNAEQEESKKLDSLKAKIAGVYRSPDQDAILKAKCESLSGKLSPYEALSLAAEVANIDFDNTEGRRRQIPTIVQGGGIPTTKATDWESFDPNEMSSDDRYKYILKRKG